MKRSTHGRTFLGRSKAGRQRLLDNALLRICKMQVNKSVLQATSVLMQT